MSINSEGAARRTTLPLDEEIERFLSADHPDRGDIRRDPYPFYDRLRAHAPVLKTARGPWLVSSYELVQKLVADERLTRESGVRDEDLRLAERVFLRSLVFRDPPAHTRLRRILSPAFSPPAIEKRRQRTRAIAKEILEDLRNRPQFDFIEAFASELPVRIICELLGMPLEERSMFDQWLAALRGLQEHSHKAEAAAPERRSSIAVPARNSVLERLDGVAADCLAYFEKLIADKRARPGEDLASELVAASDADAMPLSHEELVSTLIILHIGGHATTTDTIATGQYHLFRHPAASAALRAEPDLVKGAVEEMLRYDPPVTVGIPRVAPELIKLGDARIPAGDCVYPILAAANRDPARFPAPHRFDIRRRDNRHLAFSMGPHFCLGSALGRQEAQEAFGLLATEYPPLEPVVALEELVWENSLPHRGLEELPVRWTPQ
jgi:cytochrome P450